MRIGSSGEGGMVQDVLATEPADLLILDYDTDGGDRVGLIDGRPCDVAIGEAGCDSVRVAELWTQATTAGVEMEKHYNHVATLAYAEAMVEAMEDALHEERAELHRRHCLVIKGIVGIQAGHDPEQVVAEARAWADEQTALERVGANRPVTPL